MTDPNRAEGALAARVPLTECQKCLHADGAVLSFTHEGVSRSIWCCPFCVYYTEQVLAEARSRSDRTHEWYEHQRARADAIQEQLNREQDRSRGYKSSRDNLSARHGEVCKALARLVARVEEHVKWPASLGPWCDGENDIDAGTGEPGPCEDGAALAEAKSLLGNAAQPPPEKSP